MTSIITTPTHQPKCPNHGCPLEGCGFPLPRKGTGTCPVSGAPFDFEVEGDETATGNAKDKFGGISKVGTWKVTGNE